MGSNYMVRTAPRPAGEGWEKRPAVTYGGAPSFWFRRTDEALEWYVFDRVLREWVFRRDEFRPNSPLTTC